MRASFVLLLLFLARLVSSQPLDGFMPSGLFDEQQMVIENSPPGTRILINAPLTGFSSNDRVLLVIYALPNGNTIEQTFGKRLKAGDDWHYDIQHIGAQTRFLRKVIGDRTLVVAYIENDRRSWPAWNASTPDSRMLVRKIVEEITALFDRWNPELVLNGHSGGGRFIFSYIEAHDTIPGTVNRIAFLDSDYGYEETLHGPKITDWLNCKGKRYLCTLAYNDSVVIYNGKPLVSPTGGTWYRSKLMKDYVAWSFRLKERQRDSLIWFTSPRRNIEFIFKPNPEGKIYHTFQVEYNGFIQSMLSGTKHEQKGYRYFGERAYDEFIADTIMIPFRRINIPLRDPEAEPGSEFMERISDMPLEEREEEIYRAAASGNIPGFLRKMVILKGKFNDAEGTPHTFEYEVMPDYLAIGDDNDFCRIPMNPRTAQRLADLYGCSLLTAKISDHIWSESEVKLAPFNYIPVGHENELVSKFVDHNAQIEKQLAEAGGHHGQLVAGIKKDVILSSCIADRPDRVVLYGWHRTDGNRIQPVYCGHIYWYVDYSHGIRFMNNQVFLDGKPAEMTSLLQDSVLFRVVTDDDKPCETPGYIE
jgi:hypothetical protein